MGCQGRGAAVTAKAIAVLGTGSDVGKSLITAGICRMLRRQGVRVAPFKAQNMSLNSFVTPEGGEIGRAQALQAEACGLPPHVDMNPILLKPETDSRSQVVLLGKAITKLEASAYFDRRQELWKVVQESYARLAVRYDVIVIEDHQFACDAIVPARMPYETSAVDGFHLNAVAVLAVPKRDPALRPGACEIGA